MRFWVTQIADHNAAHDRAAFLQHICHKCERTICDGTAAMATTTWDSTAKVLICCIKFDSRKNPPAFAAPTAPQCTPCWLKAFAYIAYIKKLCQQWFWPLSPKMLSFNTSIMRQRQTGKVNRKNVTKKGHSACECSRCVESTHQL